MLKLLGLILLVVATTLVSVTPNHGIKGDLVRVQGTAFRTTDVIVFGSRLCRTVRYGSEEITCIVPPGSGTVDVTLYRTTKPGDAPIILKNAFTYDQ